MTSAVLAQPVGVAPLKMIWTPFDTRQKDAAPLVNCALVQTRKLAKTSKVVEMLPTVWVVVNICEGTLGSVEMNPPGPDN